MKLKKINGKYFHKSIISVNQFLKKDLNILFKEALKMEKIVKSKKPSLILNGYCIAELFYQPSTRTFTSFLAAAKWLGALTIPIHGMSAYSSAVKGESIEDTVRTIYQTTSADLIIIRHPDDDSCEKATQASYTPVINGGSGKKEHPTQALLDLYTIHNELGKIKDLKVAMVGDLKNGRTIKSLSLLLSVASPKNKIFFVSPENLRTPLYLIKELNKNGLKTYETDKLEEVISKVDVLYVTRVQKEWFVNKEEYRKVADSYVIDKKMLKKAKKKMIIMHPLPRVNEIHSEVDSDSRAVYFRQMRNGLYIRMALMKLILKK